MEKKTIPPDITPEKFFTELLPETFRENRDKLPPGARAVKACITFRLEGEGGGAWSISFDGGEMKCTPGESPDSVVKIIQSTRDWRGSITGERGFEFRLPGDTENGTVQFISQETVERLKAKNGSIKFVLANPDKGNWEIVAIFGERLYSEPDCIITIDEEDVRAMRNGELNPQTAFMSGKISMAGDIRFAMEIGTILIGD